MYYLQKRQNLKQSIITSLNKQQSDTNLQYEPSESYLIAMRTLQTKNQQLQRELKLRENKMVTLSNQNKQLKQKILDAEAEKLNYQSQINNLLKQLKSNNQIVDQSKLERKVLMKEIQLLKKQKEQILTKISHQISQKAINTQYKQISNKSKQNTKQTGMDTSRTSTPINLKFEHPRKKELQKKICLENFGDKETISEELILPRQRYNDDHLNEQNRKYMDQIKEIMRNQKYLIQLEHKLEIYQKQLYTNQNEYFIRQKIKVLQVQIDRITNDILRSRTQKFNTFKY